MAGNLAYKLKELSYTELLKANTALSKTSFDKEFTIDILSNITVNPIKEILDFIIRSLSLNPVVRFGNYDNIVQDSFTLKSTDAVIVFYELINLSEDFHLTAELLSEPEIQEVIAKCKNDINIIFSNLADKPLVIFNKFSSYHFSSSIHPPKNLERIAGELNAYLVSNKPANVSLLDINHVLYAVGAHEALDKKKFARYKSLYKIEFLKHYVFSIQNVLLRRTGKLKKALIFDCDNTLWKGVIGEDGPEGIDMSAKSDEGKNYHLVQKIAAELSRKGILIGLCSKNNSAEVEDLLSKHPDMVLNQEHLIATKVNWNNKDENLKALASELNIGLDSFVFIDDSAFEVNLIQTLLPEVLTIAVPKDINNYPAMILEVAQRYFNPEPLQEDLNKLKSYKEQGKRAEAMNSIGDIDSYLATLDTKIVISKNKTEQVPRIAQLTQKTNQFNLTTKRYTETDIANYLNDSATTVFTVDVSDKFGVSGITGVAIVKEAQDDNKVMEIDSYLLSCRVLGRKIEEAFLDYLVKYSKNKGYKTIRSKFIQTNKNNPAKDFYPDHQFEIENKSGNEVSYKLETEKYQEKKTAFITLIEDQHKN
ncbi:MAG: HAD-IIIC family phosphatase [Segetibacter sp.]